MVWSKGAILAGVLTLVGAAFILPSGSVGAAAPSGTPIKIGHIQQQAAGPSSINDEPVLAAWAKWVNAHGGVAGHPVQILFDVEPNNVAVAVTNVQMLIGDGVVAIADADANDSAWAQYTENAGVPVLLSTNDQHPGVRVDRRCRRDCRGPDRRSGCGG